MVMPHKGSKRRDPVDSLSEFVRTDDGLLSPDVFVDPELYKLEQERVFGKAWLFVAHESEIPRTGDYVTRMMGEDPVIVWRGQDGEVRVFLNVCRHRGRKVCGEDVGCAAQMRCGYHGWTYSNKGKLIAVPFYEGYQGRLDKSELGLYEAPRVESYGGMVFATWEPGAGSLEDYLGEMKWVMDLIFRRSDGMEVVGAPMRWEADANWKLGAAIFAGDGTHLPVTHGFLKALALGSLRGPQIRICTLPIKNGHAAVFTSWPPDEIAAPYLALPREIWPELEDHLTPDQLKIFKPLVGSVGNIFPNTSFLTVSKHPPEEWGGPEGGLIPFLTVRQWQPKGADKMEVWSWLFVDRNTPDWWKEASRQCYVRTFGMAGMFEQDDTENWGEVTRSLKSPTGRKLQLQYTMGLAVERDEDWPGPGTAYKQSYPSDVNERAFYSHWQKMMMKV
jgi:phenylpropionate dioxygenase-like ring-hydroxylating dioxygenase large terminal subunit